MSNLIPVSIFGLGYVGTVQAACLARKGHRVIGVDADPAKVDLIRQGHPPIIEPEVPELIREAAAAGTLTATTDGGQAVRESRISLICVGTPSQVTGELDLTAVRRVCQDIGSALAEVSHRHVVVMRSTVLPDTVESVVIPELEKTSGKTAGKDFGIAMNPEFLRESTAVRDFYEPPKTVIGSNNPSDGDLVAALYQGLPGPLIQTSLRVAEMVKYTDNSFHALKIAFANEIGRFCHQSGVPSAEVMEIFCQDRKLNISPAYLKPGFAFGGSCLPKDLRALTWKGRQNDLSLPLLSAIIPSNESLIQAALQSLYSRPSRRIGVLGFSFKNGTDDLRESPVITLIETLLGKGYDLKLFDPSVTLSRLVGANRRYLEHHVPHLAGLMEDRPEAVIEHGDTLVLGNGDPMFTPLLQSLGPECHVLDLTFNPPPTGVAASWEKPTG